MKKIITFIFALALFSVPAFSQMGIGTTAPNGSAMLDVVSNAKGLLAPRMNTAERTAITSPADGLLVYDTDFHSFWFYKNGIWTDFGSGGGLWTRTGTDTWLTNTSDRIGIGTSNPLVPVHFSGEDNAIIHTDILGKPRQLMSLNEFKLNNNPDTTFYSQFGNLIFNPSTNAPRIKYLGNSIFASEIPTSNTTSLTNYSLRNMTSVLYHYGTGELTTAIGILNSISVGSNGGKIKNATGISSIPVLESGNLENFTGVGVSASGYLTGTGSITNYTSLSSGVPFNTPGAMNTTGGYQAVGLRTFVGQQGGNTSGTNVNRGIWISGNGGTAGSGGTVQNHAIYSESTAPSYFNGTVGIGTTSPSYLLDVRGTVSMGNQESVISPNGSTTVRINENWTNVSENHYSLYVRNNVNPTSNNTYMNHGIYSPVYTVVGNSSNINELRSIQGDIIHSSSGNITNAYALNAITTLSGDGSMTNAISGRFLVHTPSGTGTITNAHTILAMNSTLSRIQNKSGITIQEMTNGTNNSNLLIGTSSIPSGEWSIYNSSTKNNYLNGDVGIGTTAPSNKLHISSISNPLRLEGLQSSTQSDVLVVDASGVVTKRSGGFGNDWSLTGNSGTNPATNFIGTTDAQELAIRTNNTQCLRIGTNGNIAIGNRNKSVNLSRPSIIIVDDSVSRTDTKIFHSQNNLLYYPTDSMKRMLVGNQSNIQIPSYSTYPIVGAWVFGLDGNVINEGSGNLGNVFGTKGDVEHDGSGNLEDGVGVFGRVRTRTGSTGSITQATGVHSSLYIQGSNSVTNAIGFRLNWDVNVSSTITNGYGLYLEDNPASNAFGIYQLGSTDKNYFEGNVGIGITSPTEKLDVAGNGKISGTFTATSLNASQIVHLTPLASAPASPVQGDMYFDSTTAKLRVYDGTTWQDCW